MSTQTFSTAEEASRKLHEIKALMTKEKMIVSNISYILYIQ